MDIVRRLAPEYRVSPQLALAIIRAESNFDPNARSPKNAQGLMQLIPETSARFNVRKPFDPVQNIRGGLAYLRWLLAYFRGDVTLVAAAYNAGEGAVERYRGIPPYAETRAYVQRIRRHYRKDQHPYDAKVTAPSPELPHMYAGKGALVFAVLIARRRQLSEWSRARCSARSRSCCCSLLAAPRAARGTAGRGRAYQAVRSLPSAPSRRPAVRPSSFAARDSRSTTARWSRPTRMFCPSRCKPKSAKR